jgi:hypothetical protein
MQAKSSAACEKDNIEVVVRIRPADTSEGTHYGGRTCVTAINEKSLKLDAKPETKIFHFD